MKLQRFRQISLLSALAIFQVGVPSGAAPEEAADLPAVVRTPGKGEVNRKPAVSEEPRSVMADIPAKPTRGQLEKIESDGLVLANLSGNSKRKGKEEEDLSSALKAYANRKNPGDASSLKSHIERWPDGSWTPGLQVTCGVHAYHEGRFSESLDCFEQAWNAMKSSDDPKVREASVTAAAELASLYARLGRLEDLQTVLKEVEGRPVAGADTEKIRMAAQGLESMLKTPEHSFKCGPYALGNIRESLGLEPASHPLIDRKESTVKGISLAELQELAGGMEMDWVAAQRKGGAKLPIPALVHWKVGHYAAVIKATEDGRLLVRDPTFLNDFLITPEVFDKESSGMFLIPRASLGKGWTQLDAETAAATYGKGAPTSTDKDDEEDPPCPCKGMAAYGFDFFKAGLIIQDIPVGYTTPYGPAVSFHMTYRQRSEQVLDASMYGFGPKWTWNWASYLQQTDSAGNMVIFLPGGRRESHRLDAGTGQFIRQARSLSVLVKVSASPLVYELRSNDGSKLTYSRVVGASPYPKLLLTGISDQLGHTVTLSYDASSRLTGITDALQQTSNLYYTNAAFPHLVTKISDPFISGGQRRSALFEYSGSGRLVKITDPVGIESSFGYDALQPDFISSLGTPYGVTTFTTNAATSGGTQFLEVTDPLNRKERVEYRHSFQNILPYSDPVEELPDTNLIASKNSHLYYGNTLHWDKKTYAHHPPNPDTGLNYDKAARYKWMWHPSVSYRPIGVLSSFKKPFESRIWYEYPGQNIGTYGIAMGDSEQPSKIGRRLGPTETKVDQYEYNDLGNVTKHTDPLGRISTWEYAANKIDLLFARQKNGAAFETLSSFTYGSAHLPATITDASGQVTSLTWNANQQIETVTRPGALVTTMHYFANGFLEYSDGSLPGSSDRTSYTYDIYGRTRTITSPGAHVLTYDYDALDRPTLVTYPDNTTEQFAYQRGNGNQILDLTHYKDREGRWTLFGYNALRERVSVLDPLLRSTVYNWCYCGALQDLYDGEGKRTHWDYDISGRMLRKKFADGSETNYTYDLAGRLSTVTDALNQVKTLSWFKDGNPAGITYTGSVHPTANVSYTYDPVYGRLSSMTDGTGLTSYTYHPVDGITFGAGNLHTIDSPLANDVIAYTYDALGRSKTRSIDGVANTVTINNYDALGRVTQLTNPLGTFNHTYDAVNLMLKTVAAPNGLDTTLSYQGATGDFRLQGISYQTGGTTPLSSHAYTYSPNGNIKTWAQTIGAAQANMWRFGYDRADQLEAATLNDPASTILEQHAWRYDKAGNRSSRQNGSQVTSRTVNNLNQMSSEQAGGWMRVRGETDEPATVKVRSNANPFVTATTDTDDGFSAWVEADAGANTITIEATDTSPNANPKTNQYSVNVTGTSRTPTYDANGNMTGNGTGQTYEWDAENRLLKITYTDNSTTEFTYDGTSRRTRVTEKNPVGTTTSDKRYLWDGGNQPAEERDAIGSTVLKQYHAQGEYIPAATAPLDKLFYTKDHLGSVRELTDGTGTLVARYDYDMWGKREKLSGTSDTEMGYTGHRHHAKSGLVLTWYRTYDPVAGIWLSRDPLESMTGEMAEMLPEGLNLYAYVGNNPINSKDGNGLMCIMLGNPDDLLQTLGAQKDFYEAYTNMKKANWKNSDKYFHCMANCNAASRGRYGEEEAKRLSDFREFTDEHIKRDSKKDCEADQKANRHGRAAGKAKKNCKTACAKYRPVGLPKEY